MDAKQQKFVLLRAEGVSFDKIAKEIKASKPTLIQWSKLFADEIKELQFHAFVQIKEAHAWNKRTHYETLLKQLTKIDTAILEADLSQSSIKDLFVIKNALISHIEHIETRVRVDAHVTNTNEYGMKEKLILNLSEA
jgi:hypothetical protein